MLGTFQGFTRILEVASRKISSSGALTSTVTSLDIMAEEFEPKLKFRSLASIQAFDLFPYGVGQCFLIFIGVGDHGETGSIGTRGEHCGHAAGTAHGHLDIFNSVDFSQLGFNLRRFL